MNFYLTKPYTYDSLKIWFREHWHKLPGTLDTDHADFRDVKLSVETNIASIEKHIKDDRRDSPVRNSYERRLITIYEGLQIKENWNLPMKKTEQKHRV